MVCDVVEGDNASLIVHEDPDLAWTDLYVEGGLGAGTSLIAVFFPQPNGPEATLRAEGKLPLPLHRISANPQIPGFLSGHIHLPVNLPRGESLSTQHHGVIIKPLIVLGHILMGVCNPRLSPIL